MQTERRKSRRLPVALDVVLNHRAQTVICTMRDLSLSGAFIDADCDLLPYAGIVEVGFSLPAGSGSNPVRVPATIQRTSESGAALRFADIGRDAYFGLVDFVSTPVAESLRRTG